MKEAVIKARDVSGGALGNASFPRARGEGRDEGAFPPGSN